MYVEYFQANWFGLQLVNFSGTAFSHCDLLNVVQQSLSFTLRATKESIKPNKILRLCLKRG